MSFLTHRLALWRAERDRVRADGLTLIRDHGERAYDIARHMARAERSGRLISPSLPRGHWAKVRREVKRVVWQASQPRLAPWRMRWTRFAMPLR